MGERGLLNRMAPALTLAFAAPMFAEVLPGATRFSSLFVFPIEMAVWGGGAVMARALVRKRGLGWWSLLLLGIALAVAEELLIQQTSLAPLVIRLKGEIWARAFGLNYVYLMWALAYESLWVVVLSSLFVELIFPDRREETWLSRSGAVVTAALFVPGSFLAWFTWTRIARTKVFHQPPYSPPLHWVVAGVAVIAILILVSIRLPSEPRIRVLRPPPTWLLALLGGVWAVFWFGLAALAFGVDPDLPPVAAVAAALLVLAALIWFVPRWASDHAWDKRRDYALIAGALCGSMAVSFVGFIGASAVDLWFKVVVDVAALGVIVWLGRRIRT